MWTRNKVTAYKQTDFALGFVWVLQMWFLHHKLQTACCKNFMFVLSVIFLQIKILIKCCSEQHFPSLIQFFTYIASFWLSSWLSHEYSVRNPINCLLHAANISRTYCTELETDLAFKLCKSLRSRRVQLITVLFIHGTFELIHIFYSIDWSTRRWVDINWGLYLSNPSYPLGLQVSVATLGLAFKQCYWSTRLFCWSVCENLCFFVTLGADHIHNMSVMSVKRMHSIAT